MQTFPPKFSNPLPRLFLGIVLSLVLLVAAALAAAVFFSPVLIGYNVSPAEFSIRTNILGSVRNRAFSRTAIEEVVRVSLMNGRRLDGVRLTGYCEGHYDYPGIGKVWQLTSCGSEGVMIRIAGEPLPIVVTPFMPGHFVTAVKEGENSYFAAARSKVPGTVPALGAFLVAVLVFAALGLPVISLVVPSRLVYGVGDGKVVIARYPSSREIELSGASATVFRPRSWKRVKGLSLPGYYSGVFALEGRRTTVFSTSRSDGVLLTERDGARHFLTPQEVAPFLETLSRNGAAVEP